MKAAANADISITIIAGIIGKKRIFSTVNKTNNIVLTNYLQQSHI